MLSIHLVDLYIDNNEFIDVIRKTNNNKFLVFRIGRISEQLQFDISLCTNKHQEFEKIGKMYGKSIDDIVEAYNNRNK